MFYGVKKTTHLFRPKGLSILFILKRKKMKKVFMPLLVLTLISCSGDNKDRNEKARLNDGHAYKKSANYEKSTDAAEEMYELDESGTEVQLSDRKLIKTANLSYEKKDLAEERSRIHDLLKEFKGYTTSEDEYHYSNSRGMNITVKVPANDFDAFIAKLGSSVNNFIRKDIYTEDVTEEFLDAQARIKSKQALEERYTQLLLKANQMEDMLLIEEKLAEVRNEIEGIQGRLNYLKNMTSYSTVNLRISYPIKEKKKVAPGFGDRSVSAFKRGWDALVTFFVNVISAWPALTFMLIGFFIVRKIYLRYKSNHPEA